MCQNLIGIFLVSSNYSLHPLHFQADILSIKKCSVHLAGVRIRKMGHILFRYIPDISFTTPN